MPVITVITVYVTYLALALLMKNSNKPRNQNKKLHKTMITRIMPIIMIKKQNKAKIKKM